MRGPTVLRVALAVVLGLFLCLWLPRTLLGEAAVEDEGAGTMSAGGEELPDWAQALLSLVFFAGVVLLVVHVVRSLKGKGFFPLGSRNRISWNGMDVLMVGGFLLLVMYFVSFLGYHLRLASGEALSRPERSGGLDMTQVLGLLPLLLTALYLVALMRARGREKLRGLGLKSENLARLIGLGALGYVMFFPLLFLSTLAAFSYLRRLGCRPEGQPLVRMIAAGPPVPVLMVLVLHAVVMAPLVEELLFRGFLQGYLCRRTTTVIGVFLSSLVFAAVHLNLFAGVQVFLLSLALGYLYHRTQSLAAPVALHGLHNGLQLLVVIGSFWGRAAAGG